jgi:hypothetical protein
MTLLEKAGVDSHYLSLPETAAAHGLWRDIWAELDSVGAHRSQGEKGWLRFRALAAEQVLCWERGSRAGAVRCQLGALDRLLSTRDLHPEGEIVGVHVSGDFVFELLHAERETHVTIWELPEGGVR